METACPTNLQSYRGKNAHSHIAPRLAFSLVEMVIVVAIIGIIAAIATSRISTVAGKTEDISLRGSLNGVRDAIDIYTSEHGGRTPDLDDKGNSDDKNFVKRLMETTNATGKRILGGQFGPYLHAFPPNPFNGKTKVRADGKAPGENTHGWHYDSATGRFSADDSPAHAAY